MIGNPEVKEFHVQNCISIRVKDSLNTMGKHIRALYKEARIRNIKPKGKIFTVYHEKPNNPHSIDYELFLPVDKEIDSVTIKIGPNRCAYIEVKGSYKQFEEAYEILEKFIKQHDFEVVGPPREVYIKWPLLGVLTFIPTMVTDIYFPIK